MYMGFIDETWYVRSDGHKYNLRGLLLCCHQMRIFNTSFAYLQSIYKKKSVLW